MDIVGKTLIFTDQHFGIKNNAKTRLEIVKTVFDEVYKYICEHNIKNVISCGDLFHSRNQIDVNTINTAYECVTKLARKAEIFIIVGNHDSYLKNTISINSLVMFNSINNIHIINEPTQMSINGNNSLLVPWLGDVTKFQPETFDLMFGHFDASHKYIVKAYIEDNSRKSSITDNVANMLKNDALLKDSGITRDAGDYIGDFVDVVKKSGLIFSGHIHGNREFLSKDRNFIMVGSPYQQNLGEKDNKCGFYILNEDNTYIFNEISSIPRHVEVRMSTVSEDSDLSFVSGNIVHKIYDVDIDRAKDAKISQKITDWKPFEELLPDYEVDINSTETNLQNESIALIRKSKLEYVKNYIEHIDNKVFEEQNLTSNKLYGILEKYYNDVVEVK